MKNKGFTLVELLGVIIIISLLFVIVLPKITNSLNVKKVELVTLNDDVLYTAAKLYVSEHKNEFEKSQGSRACISLSSLENEKYINIGGKKYDNSNIEYSYVQVDYNNEDGFIYSLTNSCASISMNPENCVGSCRACYVTKTYVQSKNAYYIEPKIIEYNANNNASLVALYIENDDECVRQAIYEAAREYIKINPQIFFKRAVNIYCIRIGDLETAGVLASGLKINGSSVSDMQINAQYNDNSKSFEFSNILQANTCTEVIPPTMCVADTTYSKLAESGATIPIVSNSNGLIYTPGDVYVCQVTPKKVDSNGSTKAEGKIRGYLFKEYEDTVELKIVRDGYYQDMSDYNRNTLNYSATAGTYNDEKMYWGLQGNNSFATAVNTSKGPTNIFVNLHNFTNHWNVLNAEYDYTNPNYATCGYTGVYTQGNITRIINRDGNVSAYPSQYGSDKPAEFENVKFRVLSYDDVKDFTTEKWVTYNGSFQFLLDPDTVYHYSDCFTTRAVHYASDTGTVEIHYNDLDDKSYPAFVIKVSKYELSCPSGCQVIN